MASTVNKVEITFTASEPYRVIGFQGRGHYGASQWLRRDYTATCPVCKIYFKQTAKDAARDTARSHMMRVHDAKAVVVFK